MRSQRIVTIVLAGSGSILLLISIWKWWTASRPNLQGEVVAKSSMKTWQSPAKRQDRLPILDDTRTHFEVHNPGGKPVRILEATSSCGCTKPKLSKTVIFPGETGIVEVQAMPFVTGEKIATVTLQTDSSRTPSVVLRLRLVGSLPPPYLLNALGDLSFDSGQSDSVERDVTAVVIEKVGAKPSLPLVTTDLPEIELSRPTLREERPYGNSSDVVSRTYLIKAKRTAGPARESFSGDLIVTDPWDAQHVVRLRVHGESHPPLKASPSRVILTGGVGHPELERRVSVLVRSQASQPDLVIENSDKSWPLRVGELQATSNARLFQFDLSVKPGETRSGEFTVRIRDRGSNSRLLIPVILRGVEK